MAEYSIGHEGSRRRHERSRVVHVTVKPRVYARLVAMQQALQRELGDEIEVSVATVVRKILYQHPALRSVARRHYSQDTTGDDIVT
jgi:hypothetical protein